MVVRRPLDRDIILPSRISAIQSLALRSHLHLALQNPTTCITSGEAPAHSQTSLKSLVPTQPA